MNAGDDAAESLPLLAFLWGAAHALSALSATAWLAELRQGEWSPALAADCVLLVAALAAVLRPGIPVILGALAGIQVVQTALHLPEVPNHRIVLFCVNVGLSAAMIANRFRREPRPLGILLANTLFQVAPFALAAVYFFATFAKLNTDFLDPDVSCGVEFLGHVTRIFPALGFTQARAAIWLTILVEGLLIPGLLFRRTRRAAVFVGLLFHFALALDIVKRFYNFSAVMSALLLASLGAGQLQQSCRRLEGRLSRWVRTRPFLALVRTFLAVWLAGAFVYGMFADTPVAWKAYVGVWAVWLLLGAFYVAIGAAALFARPASDDAPTGVPRVAIVAPLLLIFANGLGPYLGYKTRTSFNMYSNLRLEANAGNHLLFGRSLDVCGYLADEVELLETNDETLQRKYLDKGLHITEFEMERHLAGRRDPKGLHLVVRRNGRVETITSLPQPTVGKRLLWKLLVFRPLGPNVVKECIW